MTEEATVEKEEVKLEDVEMVEDIEDAEKIDIDPTKPSSK